MAISYIRGYELKLYTGTTSTVNAFSVESNTDLSMTATEIDVTDKNTTGWRKKLSGIKDFKYTTSGAYVSGDTNGLTAVETAFIASTALQTELRDTVNHKRFVGSVYVIDFKISAKFDDASRYDITLAGAGDMTHTTY